MISSDAGEEISRQLQEAGLTVVAPFGPYLGWVEMVVYSGKEIHQGITIFREMGTIRQVANQWCFCVEKSVPGPGPVDFDYGATSVRELISVTVQYFLGKPLTIEGWLVPKHRHPEWNEHHLRLAIAHAQPLPLFVWTQIRQRAREHYDCLKQESSSRLMNQPRTVAWDEWYSCLFVPSVRRPLADYEEPSHEETLWIRRDLLEVYLVQEH